MAKNLSFKTNDKSTNKRKVEDRELLKNRAINYFNVVGVSLGNVVSADFCNRK